MSSFFLAYSWISLALFTAVVPLKLKYEFSFGNVEVAVQQITLLQKTFKTPCRKQDLNIRSA